MHYSCSEITNCDIQSIFLTFIHQGYLTFEEQNFLMLALGHDKLSIWINDIRNYLLKEKITLPTIASSYSIFGLHPYRELLEPPTSLKYEKFQDILLSSIKSSVISEENLILLKEAHHHGFINKWIESIFSIMQKKSLKFPIEIKLLPIFSMPYYSILIREHDCLMVDIESHPFSKNIQKLTDYSFIRIKTELNKNLSKNKSISEKEISDFTENLFKYFHENNLDNEKIEFILNLLLFLSKKNSSLFIEQARDLNIDSFLQYVSFKSCLIFQDSSVKNSSSNLLEHQSIFFASTFVQLIDCPEENKTKYRFHPSVSLSLNNLLTTDEELSIQLHSNNIDFVKKLGHKFLAQLNHKGVTSLIALGLNQLLEQEPFIPAPSIPEALFCIHDDELMFQFDPREDAAYVPKENDPFLKFFYEMVYHFVHEEKMKNISKEKKSNVSTSILSNLQSAYLDEIVNNKMPWIPDCILEQFSPDQRDLLMSAVLSLPEQELGIKYHKYHSLLKLRTFKSSISSFNTLVKSWPECLHSAIRFEDSDEAAFNKLDLFLELNIPLDSRDYRGRTIFHLCIDLNKETIFKVLASHFKLLFQKNKSFLTILHYLAKNDTISFELGHFLITKFPHLINLKDSHNKKALYYLLLNDHLLSLSSKNNQYDLIKKIVEHKNFELDKELLNSVYINIYLKEHVSGKIKFYFSNLIMQHHLVDDPKRILEISLKLLPYHKELGTSLHSFLNHMRFTHSMKARLWHHVISSKNLAQIKFLGECINFIDLVNEQSLETLLHKSIRDHEIDLSCLLIELGSNPNHPNDSLITPLMLACERNQVKVIYKLLTHGADASLADINGATALARCKTHESLKLIMKGFPCSKQSAFLLSTFEHEKAQSGRVRRSIFF